MDEPPCILCKIESTSTCIFSELSVSILLISTSYHQLLNHIFSVVNTYDSPFIKRLFLLVYSMNLDYQTCTHDETKPLVLHSKFRDLEMYFHEQLQVSLVVSHIKIVLSSNCGLEQV